MANGINCYLQARVFQSNGNPAFNHATVTVKYTAMIDGFALFAQLSTQTNGLQSSVDGLQNNSVCLPVVCEQIVPGTGRLQAQQSNGNTLIPIAFSDTAFAMNESTPVIETLIAEGIFFSFEELAFSRPNSSRPFFTSVNECTEAGRVTNDIANPDTFFRFDEIIIGKYLLTCELNGLVQKRF